VITSTVVIVLEKQGSRRKTLTLRTQIVKRSDQANGFVVLPKRWIVNACTMLPRIGCFGW
jgi:hypothetical protein